MLKCVEELSVQQDTTTCTPSGLNFKKSLTISQLSHSKWPLTQNNITIKQREVKSGIINECIQQASQNSAEVALMKIVRRHND